MQNITDSWFVQGMIKATSDAWLKGWDERNGGNLTLRLDEADIAPFSADFHEKPRYITLSQPMPLLANTPFIVTGSGKFFRNVQLDPAANLGVVKIDSDGAGLGLVHALAHQPGATHNLPHGVCNAILLPIVENFNRPNAVARFARIAQAMGVETRGMSDEAASQEAINAIRTLSKRVGIPEGFSKLGVTKEDIEGWLDKALADPCAPCNPRTASRDEVRGLYLEAL
ncbi:iron-containing alcohol dehydrogenase [Salmonella enterica]|nr:iron-containing alcohol dehydrogenase [Salmonella enterica]EGR8108331.1 iron-containing alcohol dehydrogenase [Salmonella enterica]